MADMVYDGGDGVTMNPDHGSSAFGPVGPGVHPSFYANLRSNLTGPSKGQLVSNFAKNTARPSKSTLANRAVKNVARKRAPFKAARKLKKSMGGVTRGGYGPASR